MIRDMSDSTQSASSGQPGSEPPAPEPQAAQPEAVQQPFAPPAFPAYGAPAQAEPVTRKRNTKSIVRPCRRLVVLSGIGYAIYQNSDSVTNLAVGDCINEPESLDEVETVPTVDCDDEHDYEVYLVGDLTGDDYPGEGAVDEQVAQDCLTEFEGRYGTYDAENPYDFSALVPLEESWSQDKGYICLVYSVEGEADGSGRAGELTPRRLGRPVSGRCSRPQPAPP